MKRLRVIAIAVAACVCVSGAAEPNRAAIDALLRSAVEQKRVPMAVAMVADMKGVVYEHAAGVPRDAIFAIASMTKPVTSVAIMQLVEAGAVKLDAPAETYVPALKKVQVWEGGTLRPPKRAVTVRQLLSHTAGFGYEFMNRDVMNLVAAKKVASAMAGGDAFLDAPLLFDPGSRWEYGISTDWLGRIVERVSGKSLEAYFREKIFGPLEMPDSYFVVPAEKQSRVAAIFMRQQDGSLAQQPAQPAKPVTFFAGGGGLYSTAQDYLKFARAVMGGGQLGRARILSARSVEMMAQNQIGESEVRPVKSLIPQLVADDAMLPGSATKFGLGFAINTAPTASGRGAHTMSWAGIFNTFFWIDRRNQVAAVLMSQMLPFLDPGAKKLLEDFDRAAYATRNR